MKKIIKIISLLSVSIILVSCSTRMESSSIDLAASYVANSEIPISSSNIWEDIKLSEKYYNVDTVDTIPEMKEIMLKIAVATNVAEGLPIIPFIKEHGLNYPLLSNKWGNFPDMDGNLGGILSYLFHIQMEKGENPFYPNGIGAHAYGAEYTILKEDLTTLAKTYLADPIIAEKMKYFIGAPEKSVSDSEPEVYEIGGIKRLSRSNYESSYKIGWIDVENLRYVLVTDFVGSFYDNRKNQDKMKLIYQKNEQGNYVLLEGEFIPDTSHTKDIDTPKDMVRWTDVGLASNIIGGIGENYLAIAEWDRTIYLYAIDSETQEIKKTFLMQEELLKYRIKNDALFLYCLDTVYVLNKNLEIVNQAQVPEYIQKGLTEGDTYQYDAEEFEQYFSGYDITTDLTTFLYSDSEGTFLYNVNTRESKNIYQSTIISEEDGGILGKHLKALYDPFFTVDNTKVYGYLPVWEYSAPFVGYDIKTGTYSGTEYEEKINLGQDSDVAQLIRTFVLPENKGLLDALVGASYNPSILLEQEYFIIKYDILGDGKKIYLGEFSNPSAENLVKIEFEQPLTVERVLPNKKLLMKFNGYYDSSDSTIYNEEYFVFDISSYLPT